MKVLAKSCYPLLLVSLCFVIFALPLCQAKAAERPQPGNTEAELIALLTSNASPSEKAIACKLLAVHGDKASVPALSALLSDPRLASWARIALEAIPGPEADAAFRHAATHLQGQLLVGTINSIGVRRDDQAIGMLVPIVQAADAEAAGAAAVALGKIGEVAAAEALRDAMQTTIEPVRSAVAEGCIACAEHLIVSGQRTKAIELYDAVRSTPVDRPRVIEATRGAVLARGDAGIPLFAELLRSNDRDLFRLGLTLAREYQSAGVIEAIDSALDKSTPTRSALLITAIADRSETQGLATILDAANSPVRAIRRAAVKSLARVGNASCLDVLFTVAKQGDPEMVDLATKALTTIPGSDVDNLIVGLLDNRSDPNYGLAIAVAGKRRISAIPQLQAALESKHVAVRHAALTALGETVDRGQLVILIQPAIAPKHAVDQPVALQSLRTASVRMPDREACAAQLIEEMTPIESAQLRGDLLEIIGTVGGNRALQAVGEASNGTDQQLQDVGSRLLGKWPTADAAPYLLKLANKESAGKFQLRGLRGLIRIARQLPMPTEQRIALCEQAWQAAARDEERTMILGVLERYPSQAGLKLAERAAHDSNLQKEAARVAQIIRGKLSPE